MSQTLLHLWIQSLAVCVFALVVSACNTTPARIDTIVILCDPIEGCPPGDGFAQFCSLADGNVCVNVCQGADALPDGCALDEDCEAPLTCDNDQVSTSTCECRASNAGECDACVGVNTGPSGAPPDVSTSCEPGEEQFACTCMTQSGQTLTGFLSPTGCQF